MVCNHGRTQSGAIKISRLNNPVGSSTHAVYGKSVIWAPCAVRRVDCQPWLATILWGSLLYLLKDILTLYGILPCVRTAVTHPSLANFMCLGMVRRQSYDICVKKGLWYCTVNGHDKKPYSMKGALVLNILGVMNLRSQSTTSVVTFWHYIYVLYWVVLLPDWFPVFLDDFSG